MNLISNSIGTVIVIAAIAGLSIGMAETARPVSATSSSLAIEFTGIEHQTGSIKVALFNSEEGYNKNAAIGGAEVAADAASVSVSVDGLPTGKYAAKVYHDVDGDGGMNTNPFGMPIEPFAFSNNAQPNMGPATWADASFDITADGAVQNITIQ